MQEKLIGSWRLISWEISYPDQDKKSFPFGEKPSGILMYSEDGYMSANISRADRRFMSSGNTRKAPLKEKLAAFESNFSYAGPYHIEGEYVVHQVQHSLNPNMVGTQQRRRMEFIGHDQLILSADEPYGDEGGVRHHRLHWQKYKSN